MKRYVVSIGRQLGSGGKEIAARLAKELDINVYDKSLLQVAAHESGIDATMFEEADERNSGSFFTNLFSIHGSISEFIPGGSCLEHDNLFEIQSEAIREIAERENCIIVGRCAEYVLRDHDAMLSIFITADHNDRVDRVAKAENVERSIAAEIIEKGDKRRRSYHDYYATTLWGDAASYDVCINTSRLGVGGTVEFIKQIVAKRFS